MTLRARSGRRLGPMARRWRFAAVLLLLGATGGMLAAQSADTGGTVLVRPGVEKGPTKVGVGIWIIDIDSIDSAAQTFVANVFIVLRWTDPRLAHAEAEGVLPYAMSQVWHPRYLIANEIGLVRRTLPRIVEVDPSGQVVYRQRYVGPFSQPLLLRDFPFDEHLFRLHLVSPGYTPDQIDFIPDEFLIEQGLDRAAGIAPDISLPDWEVVDWNVRPLAYAVIPGGDTAGYAFEFRAARSSLYYILKVIVPLVFIVMMSWTVFWIDPRNSGTQIAVATTAMLTLIAYRFAVDTLVPRVPYLTRLDKFILGATILVFLSLIQVIMTSLLVRIQRVGLADTFDRYSRFIFPAAFAAVAYMSFIV